MAVMNNPMKYHQQGGVLLIFMLVVVLVGMVTLFGLLDSNGVKAEKDKITVIALAEAKNALIGRGIADSNHPGSLPCPDTNADGVAEPVVAGGLCPSEVGRYPWKTLGTGKLSDGDGELLWYVLSQNYRDDITAEPINGNVMGSLTVDGVNDYVAIIFAVKFPIGSQTARPSNNLADYLEGENSDGDLDFSRTESDTQNDRLITISRSEIFSLVNNRILHEIKGDATQGMVKFFNTYSTYPYADVNNDGYADSTIYIGKPSYQAGLNSLFFNTATKAMLINNGWVTIVNYNLALSKSSAVLSLNGKTLAVP